MSVISAVGKCLYIIDTAPPKSACRDIAVSRNKELCSFDTAPSTSCATYLDGAAVSHKIFLLFSFFVLEIAKHTDEHKAN